MTIFNEQKLFYLFWETKIAKTRLLYIFFLLPACLSFFFYPWRIAPCQPIALLNHWPSRAIIYYIYTSPASEYCLVFLYLILQITHTCDCLYTYYITIFMANLDNFFSYFISISTKRIHYENPHDQVGVLEYRMKFYKKKSTEKSSFCFIKILCYILKNLESF